MKSNPHSKGNAVAFFVLWGRVEIVAVGLQDIWLCSPSEAYTIQSTWQIFQSESWSCCGDGSEAQFRAITFCAINSLVLPVGDHKLYPAALTKNLLNLVVLCAWDKLTRLL